MEFFIKIFYAIFFVLAGIGILKYRRTIKSWTGNFYWAEKYIGRGGTYFVIMLIGIFLIFLGVLYPFGGLELIFGTSGDLKNATYKIK